MTETVKVNIEKVPFYASQESWQVHNAPVSKLQLDVPWQLMIPVCVLIYGSHSVLLSLCKEDGEIPFNSSAMVLLIEVSKLCYSLTMTGCSRDISLKEWPLSLSGTLAFAVSAVLYSINNNVVVFTQKFMDPASFQVLSNIKIVATALLYRLVLKRKLTSMQLAALGLLTIGSIINSIGGIHSKGPVVQNELFITPTGLLLVLMYSAISGFAGVNTERILKQHYQMSLHIQNSLLYTFGVMLNFLSFASSTSDWNLFHGFSGLAWLIVVTQAVNGLMMSVIFKHSSNILRLFVISSAMLVATVMSRLIFKTHITLYFGFSVMLVSFAVYMYFKK